MSDKIAEDMTQTPATQHIWTAWVTNVCQPDHPREMNFTASYDFDAAYKEARRLIAKKWPNKFERWPDAPWHPDFELVGLRRGLELDDEREEPL